jgi:large subunit ribosomal protein L17
MRHRLKGRQFGRNTSHRKALFRTLVTSLIQYERIETTIAKAKELRGIADRMITLGKRGDLHSKRQALSYILSRDVVTKLFDDIAVRTANRPGGFTRIIQTRNRLGDSAQMAIIELVDAPGTVYSGPSAKPRKKAEPKPKAAAVPAEVVEEVVTEDTAEAVTEEAVAEAPAEEAPVVEAKSEDAPADEAPAEEEKK